MAGTGTAGSWKPGNGGRHRLRGTTGAAGSTSAGAAGTTSAAGSTAVEGWSLNNYADTRINLADPARASSPAPALTVDTTAGNADAGSLKVTAHFTDWKQYVDTVINVSPQKMLASRVVREGGTSSPADVVLHIDSITAQ